MYSSKVSFKKKLKKNHGSTINETKFRELCELLSSSFWETSAKEIACGNLRHFHLHYWKELVVLTSHFIEGHRSSTPLYHCVFVKSSQNLYTWSAIILQVDFDMI